MNRVKENIGYIYFQSFRKMVGVAIVLAGVPLGASTLVFSEGEQISTTLGQTAETFPTPYHYDWDGDGDRDLLIGYGDKSAGVEAGGVKFVENSGSDESPQFEEPVYLEAGGSPIHLKSV